MNATKEPKARLRGTSAVFGAEKPSFEDKLETLTALNSTTTRIADIDRIIAEKERELFAKYKTAINSSSSSTSVKVVPVWRLVCFQLCCFMLFCGYLSETESTLM